MPGRGVMIQHQELLAAQVDLEVWPTAPVCGVGHTDDQNGFFRFIFSG